MKHVSYIFLLSCLFSLTACNSDSADSSTGGDSADGAAGSSANGQPAFSGQPGTVWATVDNNKVLKIDAKNGVILAVYPVGSDTGGIAASAGQAMFINYDQSKRVGRIKADGTFEQTEAEGSYNVYAWDGAFWSTVVQGLIPIDSKTATTGTLIQTTDVMNIVWNDAAYVGNGIACLPTGTTAVFVNLKTQKLEGQVDFSSKAPNIETALSTLAAGEGAVWISAYNGTATLGKRTLIQIDPTAKKIGKTLDFTWDANGSDGLLAANGYVWISKQDSTKVIRVDPKTVKQVDEIELGGVAHVVDGPGEMAHGAGAVWVADFAGNRICRIDDTTTAVACIDLGHSPNDLTVEQ